MYECTNYIQVLFWLDGESLLFFQTDSTHDYLDMVDIQVALCSKLPDEMTKNLLINTKQKCEARDTTKSIWKQVYKDV